MTTLEALKRYFGYDDFRSGQETLINGILAGKDVMGVMPTGAGKSVCFQIPALMMEGIAIIVSPLISLMKDQVNVLTQSGISAAFINSSLTGRQISEVLSDAKNGMHKLIYVAPERLLAQDFLRFAQSAEISMLCVDEAHCISQWGHDFRPSYSKISEFIASLPRRPILSAFTATATEMVRNDIAALLGLNEPIVLVAGFNRQNLYYEIQKPKDKYAALTAFLRDRKESSGIVYCSTRATVEEVCEKLKENGYKASCYHAGLSENERHGNQDDFLYDRIQIMVATNAFGLGIDKSNVSFVVHYNIPKDIESYYQEAGRAGRDGEPADCILFYSGQDMRTNLWLLENDPDTKYPDKETEELLKERGRKRLREMSFYCATKDCLRGYILKYFGENPPNTCDNCSNCATNFEIVDITIDAQKILSCVVRMKERYGVKILIETLRGSKSDRVLRLELDKLSTYGISEKSDKQLREIVDQLILMGYLIQTNDEYPVLRLGERASEVLRGNETVEMKLSRVQTLPGITRNKKQPEARPISRKLLATLRELRLEIAKEQNVPAFVIFADSTLLDMCIKLPATRDEFLDVSGVGQVKLERYGDRFLNAIAKFSHSDEVNEGEVNEFGSIPSEFDSSSIEITEDPATVNVIADRINCVLITAGYDKISGARINDWLVFKGYMKIITENGKNFKAPTDDGTALGIAGEERFIRGENVKLNFYGKPAQEFIARNALEIAGFRKV